MSENEKHDSTDRDCESDNEHIETATSDKKAQVSHGSSRTTNHNLQQPKTESSEVHPNDVIIIEQLSDEPLGESSSENLDCKVIYEFPSEDESKHDSSNERKECKVTYETLNDHESENVSHLFGTCEVPSHKIPQVSDHTEYRSVPQIVEKPKDKLTKVFNPKSLNEESPDDTSTAGTSRESDRKRKKGSISLLQNKKYKEVESSSTPVTHISCDREDSRQDEISDHSSDEFADIEDSSSSDNNDSIATSETSKPILKKIFDADIPQRIEGKEESLDENNSMKINDEASSSNSNDSTNDKSLGKAAAKKSLFPSTLKGETIPDIILTDDMKKKFEIPMPTILEFRESSSDEQILQPNKSKSNPLIMKTSVVKRKDRCNVCNARLGLCAIKCRCGGYYCAKHRYDKEHNCTFDYKSMGAAEIEKNNPRIVAEKVRKL